MDYSKSSNGRINLNASKPKQIYDQPDISDLFAMYDKIPANQCTTLQEPFLGQLEDTILSKVFFSESNIRIIQNGIRAGVYKKSNGQYTISTQDYDSIYIIMRSIFLQHSVNNPQNITQQIEELNKMVLDYCIPKIYSEAQGYIKYLSDVGNMAVPMSNPIMTSQNDKRTHKMPKWF
jgi:hypothetical protein